MSLEENLNRFERLGADYALIRHFDQSLAEMLPEDYVESLVDGLRAKAIVIGENYTFGREGRGNAQMVQLLSKKYGYRAKVVEPVADAEGLISSTRIRSLLHAGETERAKELLDIH